MRTDMKMEQIGSAIIQPKAHMSTAEMITPTVNSKFKCMLVKLYKISTCVREHAINA